MGSERVGAPRGAVHQEPVVVDPGLERQLVGPDTRRDLAEFDPRIPAGEIADETDPMGGGVAEAELDDHPRHLRRDHRGSGGPT